MSVFQTPAVIARETLMLLKSETQIASMVYRDYETEFTGAKIGDTVGIRAPATYKVQDFTGETTEQATNEGKVELKLTNHFDLTIPITAKELTLELNDFSKQILQGVAVAWAERLDQFVFEAYKDIYNFIGSAGSPADTLAKVTDIDRIMNQLRIPMRDRAAFVDPLAKAKLMQIEAFHRADARGDGGSALARARMGTLMNLDWYMAQNVKRHTAGTQAATAGMTVNGTVSKGGTSVVIAGAQNNATFKKGDLFTIAGVTLDTDTTTLAMFVVTADATASGGGAVTLSFYPALPMDATSGVAVTGVASHSVGIAFVKQAIALAVVPLEKPMGTDKATTMSSEGFGVRVVQGYDTKTKKDTISFDALAGIKVIDPRLAVRLLG